MPIASQAIDRAAIFRTRILKKLIAHTKNGTQNMEQQLTSISVSQVRFCALIT